MNFVSWNCRGLNAPVKRSKVLSHLRKLEAHIIYLQETHLKVVDHTRLRKNWIGQIYHSTFQAKARGTAILIHKSVPFICSNVLADPNGRYIVVTGKIHSIPLILANIYAPNWDDYNFFRTFFSKLTDTGTHSLILGGDFNCWINPTLDRSLTRAHSPSKSAKTIQSFMEEFNMSDPWRFLYPNSKQYSFFSNVHKTFTRIDYFLINNNLLPSVQSVTYNPIVISDHAPISLTIGFDGPNSTRPPWRFNTRLLSSDVFVQSISNQINTFIEINKTPDISASTLWDTLKAYLRGSIISYTAFERRTREAELSGLMQKIGQLDTIYAANPSPDLYKERLALQANFNICSTHKEEELLLRSRYKYYEQGDKAGRLLAHQLKQESSSHQILQIRTPLGMTTDPKQINDHFKDYYSSLYASEHPPDSTAFDLFFYSLDIPKVDEEAASRLDQPLSVEELGTAMASMQCARCPGPDGYPIEFYRTFFPLLAPLLVDMYNESYTKHTLPSTLTQATISLILKKNKDPLDCTSYRPISLLNVDLKLLSKLLALRLDSILPTIISPDQTGFIKNRYSFYNLRRLYNIIYNQPSSNTPEALISLDAEKAFDRVEWAYLFYTMQKFGLGHKFITWAQLLYSAPKASVRTNNNFSEYFCLHRSTRQGCPLSPLLFAIAIEPLAVFLRSNQEITGVFRSGIEHKVSLYADDLLLYVSNLSTSIPAALKSLATFGSISGYKLNLSKSELFPLNAAARAYPTHSFPFKIANHRFTYLGVQITEKFHDLYKFNFATLLSRVQKDFERWSLLPLSLPARINSVKMNTLPKFSYLFQSIPIFLPQTFFRKIESLVTEFIWNRKPPRIRKSFLQRPKKLGGMALPNFQYYYWAANIRALHYWLHSDTLSPPPTWLQMEALSCKPTSLKALMYSPLGFPLSPYTKNVCVKTSLRIWNQFRKHFNLKALSTLSPLTTNPVFPPSLIDGAWSVWSMLGIRTINDLYIDGLFASFQQLSEKYSLPKPQFFRYLQIRSLARSLYPNFPNAPPASLTDSLFMPLPNIKGMISYIYNSMYTLRPVSLNLIKTQWEEDLGDEISDELWESILHRVHSSSICAKHGLIQCKIVHRIHWTRVKLSQIFPDVDPTCERCHSSPASLAHTLWSCPNLHEYWSKVFDILSDVLELTISPSPFTALFGVLPPTVPLSSYKADFVAFITLVARRLILLRWKSSNAPSFSSLIKDILSFMKIEKIRNTIKGSTRRFYKTWGCLSNYIDNLNLPSVAD